MHVDQPLRLSLLLAVALAATACTPLIRPNGEEPLSPEETRLRGIEGKLSDLNKRVLGVENKDETRLQDDLRTLRGEIERLRFDVDGQERRAKELYQDLDRRIQKLEYLPAATVPPYAPMTPSFDNGVSQPPLVGVPSAAASAPALSVDPRLGGATGAAAGGGAEEETAYLKAFDALKAGRYDSAIAGFRAMLEKWPQGNFSDNGWYWMGESYYVKQQYKAALDSFSAMVERFPASPKVADALFKAGLSQWALKQGEAAKASWRRVVKDYPGSNAAGLARQRLDQAR
ncbi:MAG: tol-pal system protein YbgF [Stagnimonas sp.]|nr:tol-pal system protein YbgF [Stagnimonas sp.]